ncbi:MAG: class I SAM-dependent methyltransferase [Solirubrobacterales bacterium]
MGELRRKAGVAKRRLLNAKAELFPSDDAYDGRFTREVGPSEYTTDNNPATKLIHARLDQAALSAIGAAIGAADDEVNLPVPPGAAPKRVSLNDRWNAATGIERMRLDLVLGAYLEVPELLSATGLTTAQPPADVHAMSHTPFAAGGGFYQADMIAGALESVGAPIADGQRVLDFGCSSGRVARALAAAYPGADVFGCDPNGQAIEWAASNLLMAEFSKSENDPPLDYPDDHFDAAFGVSIWSHYSERLALKWYDEMHRVVKPGGHLISTTHGPESVAFYSEQGLRTTAQLSEILDAIYRRGYWYAPEFGEAGDWGVVNPDWGTSFVSAEWMLDNLRPKWQVAEYAQGRNERNQDVYVLRKAAG